jgi:hypothetical protein
LIGVFFGCRTSGRTENDAARMSFTGGSREVLTPGRQTLLNARLEKKTPTIVKTVHFLQKKVFYYKYLIYQMSFL